MTTKETGGNTIAAFAIGALLGAAVALLLAPASGEETRRKLKQQAKDGADRLKRAAGDLVDDVKDRVKEAL